MMFNRKRRAMLIAIVERRVCRTCKSAPAHEWSDTECSPCAVKRIDLEEFVGGIMADSVDLWGEP
jgi:hypothetical protein